jgi:hypothetical protein
MNSYPDTKRLRIDNWNIIPSGLMKGIYHNCDEKETHLVWKFRVVTKLDGDIKVCPACGTPLPKDVESTASLLDVL